MGNYLAPLKKWLYINKSTNMLDIILLLLLSLIVFLQIFLFYRNSGLSPPSYRIAVIGFPKVGKTTLITILFRQLLNGERREHVFIMPRGSSTIDKINDDYAKLDMNKKLAPTTDQDLFAYRFDMERGKWFKQRYKIEIGDFPGEDSEQFAKDYDNKFHKTPYFKWMMEADAFMIIFDIADLLQNEKIAKKNKTDFDSAIRSAWQHVAEYHSEGKRNLKDKPVVLVFAKSDLFNLLDETMVLGDVVSKKVQQWGFYEIPDVREMDNEKLKNGKKLAKEQFADLINYFNSESNQFNIVFASAFSGAGDSNKNKRLGMKELTEKILPAESSLLSALLKLVKQTVDVFQKK